MNTKLQDITAPENLEIQIKSDSKVVWINIDGVCVFRACKIQNLILTDNRSHSRKVVDILKKQFPFKLEVEATPYSDNDDAIRMERDFKQDYVNDKPNTKSTTSK